MATDTRSTEQIAEALEDRAHHSQDDQDSALYLSAAELLRRLQRKVAARELHIGQLIEERDNTHNVRVPLQSAESFEAMSARIAKEMSEEAEEESWRVAPPTPEGT